MITEGQRRALFALREALRLCEDANLELGIFCDTPGVSLEQTGATGRVLAVFEAELSSQDIDSVL